MEVKYEVPYERKTDTNEHNTTSQCRTCLCVQSRLHSIFDYCNQSNVYINDMIMSFCSVKIIKDDALPSKICSSCIENVRKAYIFKRSCEKAETILREHLYGCNSEDSSHFQESEFFNIKEETVDCSVFHFSKKNVCIRTTSEDFKDNTNIFQIKSEVDQSNNLEEKSSNFGVEVKTDCDHIASNIESNKVTKARKIKRPVSSFESVHKTKHAKSRNIFSKSKTIVRNEKMHYCSYCDYKTNQSTNLKRHIRQHTNDKPYSCEICHRKFARNEDVKIHLRTHTGEKPYLCDECHYSCTSSRALSIHKQNKHSLERRFSCDQCSFKAKNRTNLITHIKKHTGEPNFICDQCSYKSFQLATLKNHKMMAHTGERPFECDQCSYKCITLGYLKLHKQTHLTIKRFSCCECPYMCNTKFRLKRHQLTHTGEKPLSCSACEFRCVNPSSLKRHIKRLHSVFCKPDNNSSQ